MKFGKALNILLWLAALLLLVENISLVLQNRGLLAAAAPQITAGTQLKMLSGATLDGNLAPVGFPSGASKLLIITFSPGCPACQANQPSWVKLAAELKAKGIRTVWVSRDSIDVTKDYCLKHGMAFTDVLAEPSHGTWVQLGLARVPNTLLIGNGGKVEKVWAGRLDQPAWDIVFAYFGEHQQTASSAPGAVAAPATACTESSAKGCQ